MNPQQLRRFTILLKLFGVAATGACGGGASFSPADDLVATAEDGTSVGEGETEASPPVGSGGSEFWDGSFQATGSIVGGQNGVRKSVELPTQIDATWIAGSSTVSFFGKTPTHGLGMQFVFSDQSSEDLLEMWVIRPVLPTDDFPGGTSTIGFIFERPVPWLEMPVAASIQTVSNDAYDTQVDRVAENEWRLTFERQDSADPQKWELASARVGLTVDGPRPPWDQISIDMSNNDDGIASEVNIDLVRM